jgi:hypothetical protein
MNFTPWIILGAATFLAGPVGFGIVIMYWVIELIAYRITGHW